jgi:gentisate 1,2-dioxygenase
VASDGRAEGFSSERGHPVFPVRLPSRSVSLSVGDLAPGAATSNHRHAYESMIYVIEGAGYTVIEGQRFEWRAGDAVYVPPWCWHQHVADPPGKARYLTATNMPTLVALGQTVMREEERG